MNIYLVGGAVRDQLLGLPVVEKDWVVVGGSAHSMLTKGFSQVGKDFPVFLHADTKEEYALARRERKIAPGYHGFSCEFGENVTLEEDLQRRDLTINAMAMDTHGRVIDPYGGLQDLKNKILRHVSPAFVEDPVRVLRVARFLARFHHLGFTIAEETRYLMYVMMKRGELSHLVVERVWQEWYKSLLTPNPEQFVKALRACDALAVILPELNDLFGIPNPPGYHPEVDSGEHTLMVLCKAAQSSVAPVIRFAALLHDLGKGLTPMSQWPSHHGHEARGVLLIEHLCQRLKIPLTYRKLAVLVSKIHLLIHRLYALKAETIVSTLEQADAFRQPALFEQVLVVCQADAQGRLMETAYPQADSWRMLLSHLASIKASACIADGYTGVFIKQALHHRRVAAVQQMIQSGSIREK